MLRRVSLKERAQIRLSSSDRRQLTIIRGGNAQKRYTMPRVREMLSSRKAAA